MSFILGMDTGGTYTDAVVINAKDRRILCKAKALTTKDDLTTGIQNCLEQLEFDKMDEISLISLSTTLATNAIVEGRGGKVVLLYMGAEMDEEVPAAESIRIRGRFDIMGRQKEALDKEEVRRVLKPWKGRADAVAISGYASVRNPKHEQEAAQIAEDVLGVPVICAHHLSTALGFYHRTVTAVLNGRLIPIIDDLLASTRSVLKEKGISGSIMVVKGDGTLMTEKLARHRPVETILSGPAASVIGGLALTGQKDGLVVDMGGTTTDIAEISGGSVKIRREGANVGGWLTRVQAAEISTFGIGGDSRICIDRHGAIRIGPEKVIPLCVVGAQWPELIHELRSFRRSGDIKSYSAQEADCYFYRGGAPSRNVTGKDEKMIAKLKERPHSMTYLARIIGQDPETIDLTPLVEEGVLLRIGVTPTDILHVQGRYNRWNRDLSNAGVEILARRQEISTVKFLDRVERMIKVKLASACVQAAANFDLAEENRGGSSLRQDQGLVSLEKSEAAMYLLERAFGSRLSSVIDPQIHLKKRLVAIGAPAGVWLREAGKLLHEDVLVPEHADVANAYGAAAGQVTETVEILISLDKDRYLLNLPWDRMECASEEEAKFYAIHEGRKHIEHLLTDAGCKQWKIEEKFADILVGISDMDDIEDIQEKTWMGQRVTISGTGSGMI